MNELNGIALFEGREPSAEAALREGKGAACGCDPSMLDDRGEKIEIRQILDVSRADRRQETVLRWFAYRGASAHVMSLHSLGILPSIRSLACYPAVHGCNTGLFSRPETRNRAFHGRSFTHNSS
jgi:hypothetical protein